MTSKHALFVDAYLANGQNATEAYASVYQTKNRAAAGANAGRLIKNDEIQQLIAEKRGKLAGNLEISAERVLREYARIAFADMRRFASVKGGSVSVLPSEDWTDDDAAAVAEVAETTSKDGGSIKFKLHSKTTALEALAKHLNLFPATGAINIDARNQTLYASDNLIAALLKARSGNSD